MMYPVCGFNAAHPPFASTPPPYAQAPRCAEVRRGASGCHMPQKGCLWKGGVIYVEFQNTFTLIFFQAWLNLQSSAFQANQIKICEYHSGQMGGVVMWEKGNNKRLKVNIKTHKLEKHRGTGFESDAGQKSQTHCQAIACRKFLYSSQSANKKKGGYGVGWKI